MPIKTVELGQGRKMGRHCATRKPAERGLQDRGGHEAETSVGLIRIIPPAQINLSDAFEAHQPQRIY